jgi:hypothetical protein
MTTSNRLSARKDRDFLTWGKAISAQGSVFIFAAALIVCSITVGCSSDKPKPLTTNNQIPVTPATATVAVEAPAPIQPPATKPARKKPAPKKPATVDYTDKTYGLSFQYPRRYAIETGDAAAALLLSNPIAMNFVAPGGVALAAVELPETNYTNTDFSSAFFNVSVHQTLTADQCSQFSVPQPKNLASETKPDSSTAASAAEPRTEETATSSRETNSEAPSATAIPVAAASPAPTANSKPAPVTASSPDSSTNSKLMLGDLELPATEAVSGEGTRQSDSKYFHLYQNGACYEFALNLTTDASEQGLVKHVDREQVFHRLEQILSTVKINPVAAAEVTAEAPKPAAPETPAQ